MINDGLTNHNTIKSISYSSFQELYNNYSKLLYFYSLKFVDEEAAKDIVQDIFIQLWAKRDEIEFKSSVKSYLFAMARNNCLAFLERNLVRKRYKEERSLKLQIEEVKFYQLRGGLKSLIEEEYEKVFIKALGKLPKRCSEVFLLCRNQNMKYREVASKLNISIKTVEKHMTLAMKILRVELKEHLPEVLLCLYFLS
jgi:RNA polymerase sigma-70 factor (ECF subfamily)